MTERILRRPEVSQRVGLGRSALYAAIAEGRFPRPIKISARSVGWPQSAVERWINERVKEGGY